MTRQNRQEIAAVIFEIVKPYLPIGEEGTVGGGTIVGSLTYRDVRALAALYARLIEPECTPDCRETFFQYRAMGDCRLLSFNLRYVVSTDMEGQVLLVHLSNGHVIRLAHNWQGRNDVARFWEAINLISIAPKPVD